MILQNLSMGVKNLETYLINCVKSGLKDVSLFKEIEHFNSQRHQKPILAFDCFAIVTLLCRNKEELLCAGRHQEFIKTLDTLFSRLAGNAELVFFMDGRIEDTKYDTWASRQNQKYNESLKVIDKIDQYNSLKSIAEKSSLGHIKIMITAIEEAAKKHGQLNYAVNKECDQELARFACSNHRVMAVFSNDTDFLIFPGKWRYFSTKDINLQTMKTKEYNRNALHANLRLNPYQRAILATMAGNDIVRADDLRRFHKKFSGDEGRKFQAFANFAKKITLKTNHAATVQILSKELFGSVHNDGLQRINKSIASYNVNYQTDHETSPFLQQHHLFSFNILNRNPLNLSLVFFDARERDKPSYFDLSLPLLQRQAGILLLHSCNPDASLIVYSKVSHLSNYNRLVMTPFFPPFEVPPLLEELYSDDKMYDEDRYQLLKWTINWKKLENFDLRMIPDNYLIDILTILLMVYEEVITFKEADIFLWTIKNVEQRKIPDDLRPPMILNPRAFRLAFLYVKMFANVARSIEVCGLKKRYWKSCTFDGVFFHQEYQRLEHYDLDNRVLFDDL